ncbi:MAG: 1-deoxy-D-xylulose-5-phosphate reductoisomerase [Gammaproteobacteria bacterium]|nr:1-deoxy-D-xylulose-5-phosphate reductoisomerase [Gammaproteobacteria bacterium]MCP5135316.1 1-deoxy-D-xylulose-5-phosphate reductoisomerase [Gammaproteobacteria bacterium]
MSSPIGVTVLGSTGSVGVSTLDVLGRHPERYRVVALTANQAHDKLFEQCRRFEPQYAVMVQEQAAEALRQRVRAAGIATEVLSGADALSTVAALPQTDYVMAAIVGAAGLLPSLAAAEAGKRVMLANKEALVMSGQLFMDAVSRNGAELLPIDSEHNAIFQCMPDDFPQGLGSVGVRRILLTASGGPFRTTPLAALKSVTPAQAVAHPNWEMGRKISVDSATMMNKGLEVIEACWLFGADTEQVQVVLHPQSVVHSMVQYVDGSVLAQLGNPDMRTPIAHCLAWPERIESGVADLDVFAMSRLDFEPPDLQRFPCLRLAYEARQAGGLMSTALNAANEVAVEAFLDRGMDFLGIPAVIESVLGETVNAAATDLRSILDADAEARQRARRQVRLRKGE